MNLSQLAELSPPPPRPVLDRARRLYADMDTAKGGSWALTPSGNAVYDVWDGPLHVQVSVRADGTLTLIACCPGHCLTVCDP